MPVTRETLHDGRVLDAAGKHFRAQTALAQTACERGGIRVLVIDAAAEARAAAERDDPHHARLAFQGGLGTSKSRGVDALVARPRHVSARSRAPQLVAVELVQARPGAHRVVLGLAPDGDPLAVRRIMEADAAQGELADREDQRCAGEHERKARQVASECHGFNWTGGACPACRTGLEE